MKSREITTLITDAESQRMLERAAEARQHAVTEIAGHGGSAAEREALVGSVFRHYSCELLKDLLTVASRDDKEGVRRLHDEELLELGRELRDVFPEGEARHAVAQVIQRELLEAERRLKYALTIRGQAVAAEIQTSD